MLTTSEFNNLVQQITDEIMDSLAKNHYQATKGLAYSENESHDKLNMLVNLGAQRVGVLPGIKDVSTDLAPIIDHTLLKPDTVPSQIDTLCEEAMKYGFASVCIHPCYVKYAKKLLQNSQVKVCTVIGFPLGANTTAVKTYEAQMAEYDGAEELDMVIPIGALKSKAYDYVENDIASIVKHSQRNTIIKVILETALLNDEEKIIACQLSKKAGADFVKTSTGFGPSGAKAHDISLMRRTVGLSMGVKASGGVRDRSTAETMVNAGASRIGASASIKIVEGKIAAA